MDCGNGQNQVDGRVFKNILRDIVCLNNHLDIDEELLDVPPFNVKKHRLVCVPLLQEVKYLRHTNRATNWTDGVLECPKQTEDKSDAASMLLVHLSKRFSEDSARVAKYDAELPVVTRMTAAQTSSNVLWPVTLLYIVAHSYLRLRRSSKH